MRTQAELDDRAARVAAGQGVWRNLVGGKDLVGEVLDERRQRTAADAPAGRVKRRRRALLLTRNAKRRVG